MTTVLVFFRFPGFSVGAMRGLWAVAVIVLSLPAVGAAWTEIPGPHGSALFLPPGCAVVPYAEGITRVELPIPAGTLLVELFLLLEGGIGRIPRGRPVWIGDRQFLLHRWLEGAAGSRYEAFRFAAALEEGKWVSLTFVIHTANPGMFPEPPPPYDRGAVLDMMWDILANTRFPLWQGSLRCR